MSEDKGSKFPLMVTGAGRGDRAPQSRQGWRNLGWEGEWLCSADAGGGCGCVAGSAEVTSALISTSSAAELPKPKAQVPLSWHCSGEMPWLGLDPGSKTPGEHFPHGSERKGESKTPQGGGCHKNLALGLIEAKQGDRGYGKPKVALFCFPGQYFSPLNGHQGLVRAM